MGESQGLATGGVGTRKFAERASLGARLMHQPPQSPSAVRAGHPRLDFFSVGRSGCTTERRATHGFRSPASALDGLSKYLGHHSSEQDGRSWSVRIAFFALNMHFVFLCSGKLQGTVIPDIRNLGVCSDGCCTCSSLTRSSLSERRRAGLRQKMSRMLHLRWVVSG